MLTELFNIFMKEALTVIEKASLPFNPLDAAHVKTILLAILQIIRTELRIVKLDILLCSVRKEHTNYILKVGVK